MVEDVKSGKLNGKMVWICDLRFDNYGEKPIRHVKPQEVLVRPNSETTKRIYYSESHFVGLNKKGEPVKSKTYSPVDNTGYRSRSGTALQVFDNEADCRKAYTKQIATAIHGLENYKKSQIKMIDEKINDLKNG
jgi:hypothetical protein